SLASTAPASSLVPPMSTPMMRLIGIRRHYMYSRMSEDLDNRAQSEEPAYRTFGGRKPFRSAIEERPYTVYRSRARGLRTRLGGQEDSDLRRSEYRSNRNEKPKDGWAVARRVGKYLAIAIAAWLLLSTVLFILSAQIEQGNLPASAKAALTSGGSMLTSTDTI